MNVAAVIEPLVIEHEGDVTRPAVPVMVQLLSPVANEPPVIMTRVPGGPVIGLRVIIGILSTALAEPEGAVAVIVKELPVTTAESITKDPVRVPAEMVQENAVPPLAMAPTGTLTKVRQGPLSPGFAHPVPDMVMVVVGAPAFGVSTKVGTAMTGVGRLYDAHAKIADTTKNTVIANLERRILNSKHAFLWRLAMFHDI